MTTSTSDNWNKQSTETSTTSGSQNSDTTNTSTTTTQVVQDKPAFPLLRKLFGHHLDLQNLMIETGYTTHSEQDNWTSNGVSNFMSSADSRTASTDHQTTKAYNVVDPFQVPQAVLDQLGITVNDVRILMDPAIKQFLTPTEEQAFSSGAVAANPLQYKQLILSVIARVKAVPNFVVPTYPVETYLI
mmetsp:Transcript_1323/g.1706  ORF Transcript_1323/g.1706 Transcript_1323/m.1706 type:complete len:187 (-) Transcript_1323:34-594(-)|eukprot:CAMPEP_0170488706 /NCGR_PEP_ID=MMETSP0208-20121228/7176_1 /TAXON_ID=197538 /ORGANISM="Strombidium inclinatum, Strain S3" /LENGTH=186 /DNA_ID=CAMNT_0010763349 /DNA_START=379 /DNA_END=939 /DNA_ORIENTATION=+